MQVVYGYIYYFIIVVIVLTVLLGVFAIKKIRKAFFDFAGKTKIF